LIIQTRKQTIY